MELDLLKGYFTNLAKLKYDIAGRSLNGKKNYNLVPIFHRLISSEDAYHSLEFLRFKRFRQENFLLTSIQQLLIDLIKDKNIKENQILQGTRDTKAFIGNFEARTFPITNFYMSCIELIKARRNLIQGLKLISGHKTQVPFRGWYRFVEDAHFDTELYHFSAIVKPWADSLKFEIQVIKLLLECHQSMMEYQFGPSILKLHSAHTIYGQWKVMVSNNDKASDDDELENSNQELSMLSRLTSLADLHFGPTKPTPKISRLMVWLELFYDHLHAKLTFYFYKPLLERERCMGGDSTSLFQNLVVDYPQMIRNFKKKSNCHHITVIYEVNANQAFSELGFQCKLLPCEPLSGLNSFPEIFDYPDEPPKDYKPGIVSMIMMMHKTRTLPTTDPNTPSVLSALISKSGFQSDLTSSPTFSSITTLSMDKSNFEEPLPEPYSFRDKSLKVTFHFAELDPGFTLVAIGAETDGSKEFVSGLASLLRLNKVVSLLGSIE